ncbi:MAG: ribonuclease P protein component [Alphaproteobacteria bacterium RIFOXYD12_FULL_60_8]|nr:MAG: ribonuclease P protein component [Alphaproteobacteria bacterium RIFOXYD12_FULL_60_8]
MTPSLERLKRRSDFLRVAATRLKWVAPGLILQMAPTPAEVQTSDPTARLGFTVSKKVGNAVHRNRARRRLKALASQVMPGTALMGRDYVLIGRVETITRPYDLLLQDLQTALKRLNAVRVGHADRAATNNSGE